MILMSAAVFVPAQQDTTPDPTPTPFRTRPETGVEKVRRLDRDHERLEQQAYNNLYGQDAYAKSPRFSPEWRAKMVSLYRKPKEAETEILKPDEQHFQKYAEFLKEKDTGIFKLIPDQGCDGEGKIVNASPECANYDFPGAGSSYSFRLQNYRIRRLADISLVKNSLSTQSVFNGAIYVVLGDIPIEEVNLNTPGLKFLQNYKPVKNSKEALEMAQTFARGVKQDGHIYGRGVFATKDNTFAMRSIAYRGKFRRSEAGVVYNELDFDKRRDIIVAFRVIDVGEDGSATIVWKILRETKAPKLKIYQKQK